MLITIIGVIASTLSVSMFLPQAIHVWTRGFTGSVGTPLLAFVCALVWTVYGFMTADPVIIGCNVSFAFSAFAVLSRWIYERQTGVNAAVNTGR